MKPSVFKMALVFLALIFVYLQYVLWFDQGGIFHLIHLKRELSQQVLQNDELKQKNQDLYEQVERLKQDPEVTEGRARGELGMIKKGEKFYQIIKSETVHENSN